MPHRIVERTIGALQAPSMLTSSENGEILAVNPLLQEVFDIVVGDKIGVIFTRLGWVYSETAFAAALTGMDMASAPQEYRDQRIWTVASPLPSVSGWPPSVFLTLHVEPDSMDQAIKLHMRDRIAMEAGVLVDRIRFDIGVQAQMAIATAEAVNQMAEVWCERLESVEPLLPQV